MAGSGFVGEELLIVPAVSVLTECYKDMAPFAQLLTLRNVAGQAPPLVREAPAGCGFDFLEPT